VVEVTFAVESLVCTTFTEPLADENVNSTLGTRVPSGPKARAANVAVSPAMIVSVAGARLIVATLAMTVTITLELSPQDDALIVAVPGAFAWTIPSVSTVAMFSSDELNEIRTSLRTVPNLLVAVAWS
jgi:hypothetical protein